MLDDTVGASVMVSLRDIGKTYLEGGVRTVALKGVNLVVREGEFVSVMGPSGCGKSSLLNLLGLIDTPTEGEYQFLGRDITGLSETRRARIRKENIGFVFQNFNLIDDMTVYENLELPLLYLKVPSKERRRRLQEVLELLEIVPFRDTLPLRLSGGQQQRVAVARAIVSRPRLILADEPTGNLDSTHGDDVMRLLADLNDSGTTVVMVTHSPVYARFGHRIVNLFDGRVMSETLRETGYV